MAFQAQDGESDGRPAAQSNAMLAWDRWHSEVQRNIPQFCRRVFWGSGVWQINRHALGWDLLRAPVNLFLSPLWVVLQLCAFGLQRFGAVALSRHLRRCPPGLRTRAHVEIDQQLGAWLLRERPPLNSAQQRVWNICLLRYQASRQATAEILANLVVLTLGGMLFTQFTPGGLGLGREVAQQWHFASAVDHFWAGQTLGRIWFSVFPPDTPMVLSVVCIMGALCIIALVSAAAGFMTDPLQYLLGWHQKRLQRLVGALHQACAKTADNSYQPSEPWLARLFDVLDWLRLGS